MELSDVTDTLNDVSGAYVNRVMMNGSAYNSPNLANNRRGPPIQERPTFGESALNPDVVPNEKFPSMPDSRSLTLQNGEKDAQNDKSVSNSGNCNIFPRIFHKIIFIQFLKGKENMVNS